MRRRAPEWPLQYWTLDGWDVELAFRDKRPGKATTYTNRVTMVVVLDACCKYPIGYAVGLHETPALIREALRVAHRHTESLFGQMMRAQQIQSDNYAIKTLSPLYGVSARLVTPAAVGNAKAKIIEPWFKYFNKKYCQLQTNWTGFGVTSRRELQPNAEALAARRASFPDFDGVCAQVVAMLEQERAELRERYLKAWDAMPTERRLPLSMPDYLTAYGETTGRTNLLRGSGITMQIDGRVYEYGYFAVEPEIITAVPPGFTLFADEPMPRWEDGCFGWHGELVLRIDGTLWRYPAGGTLCDAGRRVRYFISIDPKTLRRADFVAWRTEETRKNIE